MHGQHNAWSSHDEHNACDTAGTRERTLNAQTGIVLLLLVIIIINIINIVVLVIIVVVAVVVVVFVVGGGDVGGPSVRHSGGLARPTNRPTNQQN